MSEIWEPVQTWTQRVSKALDSAEQRAVAGTRRIALAFLREKGLLPEEQSQDAPGPFTEQIISQRQKDALIAKGGEECLKLAFEAGHEL